MDKTKRCKAIVTWNVGSFDADDTGAGASAHARAPLSVFLQGHPTAPSEIGGRPFLFFDDSFAVYRKGLLK